MKKIIKKFCTLLLAGILFTSISRNDFISSTSNSEYQQNMESTNNGSIDPCSYGSDNGDHTCY